jgi:hypothetical protein
MSRHSNLPALHLSTEYFNGNTMELGIMNRHVLTNTIEGRGLEFFRVNRDYFRNGINPVQMLVHTPGVK